MNMVDSAVWAAVGVAGAFVLNSILKTIETAIKKNVTVQSPESKAIEKMAPAINAVLEIQGPQTCAMIAMLEAQKGYCNGNVDRALKEMEEAKAKYDAFLHSSAQVKHTA
jgi:hypothetical protein